MTPSTVKFCGEDVIVKVSDDGSVTLICPPSASAELQKLWALNGRDHFADLTYGEFVRKVLGVG